MGRCISKTEGSVTHIKPSDLWDSLGETHSSTSSASKRDPLLVVSGLLRSSQPSTTIRTLSTFPHRFVLHSWGNYHHPSPIIFRGVWANAQPCPAPLQPRHVILPRQIKEAPHGVWRRRAAVPFASPQAIQDPLRTPSRAIPPEW